MRAVLLENPYMNKEILKNSLRTLLDTNGWTEETLHEKSGVAQSSINRILNNSIDSPRLTTLVKIAKAFGVPMSALTGDDSPTPPITKTIKEETPIYGAARETFRLLEATRQNRSLNDSDYLIISALIKHLSREITPKT